MVTLHVLCHCAINNPKLVRNDHFTLMTISGHKTNSVSRRYNVVTDAELQDGTWMNDEKIGVHMSVHQTPENEWSRVKPDVAKFFENTRNADGNSRIYFGKWGIREFREKKRMERETGIEPATPSLGSSYSTNWAILAQRGLARISV